VAAPLVPTITATMVDSLVNDDGDTKADPTNGNPGTTEKIKYTVTISNSGTDATNVVYTNQIDAHTTLVNGSITTQPIAANDSYSVLGNVRIQVADGGSDLLGNDCDPDPLGGPCTNTGLTITTLAGDNTGPSFSGTSNQGGQVTASATDGSFQYNPPPGFTGSDSFTYTVTDSTGKTDTATVNITVSGMIWFVDDSAAAGGDGRLTNPFNCLTGAGCFNLVAADDPGDNIFLFAGTYNNTSVFALLDTQKLIGQGSNSGTTLAAIAGVTVPTHSDALPVLNGDPATVTVNSTAAGIQLEQDNTLRGFTVGNTSTSAGNYDIQNATTQTVGTLNILELVLNGTGGLFRADSGGALSITLNSATTTSAGSDGFQINNASGSVTVNGGAISGVTGADVSINAGTVSFTSSGNITHTSSAAMVSVTGGHTTGTITFTGTLSATNGTGLQFNNADSITSYNFNGTTTLNGGDAGIDIVSGSGGTFNFGSSTSISNPSGTAFYVNASAPTVTMNGSITQGAAKRGVYLENNTGGSTTFTGALTLNTTTQNAFEATHTSLAGTVTVQTATNNVLSTTTGTALRINNVNIGASDVTFQSISANGASSGIVLNNTGSSGGLNVTGTGTTDGSGGTIQNTTGDAVSLTTTRSVVLKNMVIGENAAVHTEAVSTTNNVAGDGISTTGVTPVSGDTYGLEIDNLKIARTGGSGINGGGGGNIGLHVTNTEIINPGDAGTPSSTSSDEDAIGFGSGFAGNADQITGTVLIENSTFAAFIDHGIQIENAGSGTLNMTVSNVTMKNNDGLTLCSGGPCEGSAIQVIADGSTIAGGTGPTINLTVRQLTATNIDQDVIDAIADPGGNVNVTVGDPANGATNGITANCPNGDQVLRFNSGSPDGDDTATFNFNVRNVVVTQMAGTLVIFKAANSMTGKFINSTLDANDLGNVLAARGIEITADGDASEAPSMTILIDNVTLNRIGGDGIQAFLTDVLSSSSRLDLTIQNCNIGTNPANTAQTGLEIGRGNASANEAIEIRNGVIAGANGQLYVNIANNNIRNFTSANASAQGIDIDAEQSTTTHATVTNNNVLAAPGDEDYDLDVEVNTAFMCADFTGNIDSNDANPGAFITNSGDTADFQIEGGSGSLAGSNPATPITLTGTFATGTCTMPNVPTGGFFAFSNRANQPAYLAQINTAQPSADALPTDLFVSLGELTARKHAEQAKAATEKVEQPAKIHSTTGETLKTANARASSQSLEALPQAKPRSSEVRSHHAKTRKTESRDQKSEVRSHHAKTSRAVSPTMSGETVTINIGTLRAGDSVEITYEVTVDNPPNLSLLNPPRVSNQGSVSYAESGTPVLTDDPSAGGAADPTETPVDLFDTSTNLVSNINPSNFGEQVTFTATVSETPAQTPNPTGTVDFIDTSNGNAVICNDVALDGSFQATCQTSSLTAGTHNIRADYSGDGNFDSSQSNIVAQVVNACTTNPVVTKIADTDDGTCDADCSLREAIATVCTGNTITFNTAGVFATPQTITLSLGELSVAKNVTIDAPDAAGNHVTVTGNNASRVFNINSGKTVTIRDLSIIGGNSAGNSGGGISNSGTLTINNSTISGNTTSNSGGGIFNVAGSTLTITNSTISGNTANTGGGVANSDGTLTINNSTISGNSATVSGGGIFTVRFTLTTVTNVTNCTITNNIADSDGDASGVGGGMTRQDGTVTLHNTIVAGNFNEDGVTDAADDIGNSVEAASSFNLIGTGGSGGLTNGVNNNQVGVADAGLGPLANNGGQTFTHALLPTSLAVEAGDNTTATNAGLTTDQRGTGFPRIADSADANTTQTVDIGAFELHPTIENIPDKSTAEDTLLSFSFNLGDGTGALISSVTATSSNTTLVPNANLSITGSGSTRTLDITPATNANTPSDGTATITVTVTATNGQTAQDTFVLTVTEVNDNPDAVNDTLSAVNEDSGLRTIPFADLLGNDTAGPANESGQTINVTGVSNPVGGTVQINGTNVEFTPTANFNGAASFDYTITDNGTTNGSLDAKSDTATASFTINSVNDAPSFTKGPDQNVQVNSGSHTVNNWATNISAGPADESGQTLTFNVTGNTNPGLFTVGPAVDSSGTLTYTIAPATSGSATITLTLSDNGGTANGGQDTSAPQTFVITVGTDMVINDAKVAEPASGSTNMVFTVSLSAPATGTVTANFTTVDGTAKDGVGEANQDYTPTSGTVTFNSGEQVKTISVPVLSDADNSEVDETFTVTLSSPSGATITDGTATGTITVASPAGAILISELRSFGPGPGNDPNDEFVEIYNNSDSPVTVAATDASAGWAVAATNNGCSGSPVIVGTIPNGTVIPARGHYLLVGTAYSLANYGGTGATAGNLTMSADIAANANVAIFSTADITKLSSANRLDAVGFGTNTGDTCDLMREGSNQGALTMNLSSLGQHSYFRKLCDFVSGVGCSTPGLPKDTNDNSADFQFADTNATNAGAGQLLGAPGPENLASPLRRDPAINILLLDASVSGSAHPNRTRDFTPVTNGAFGTMTIRRRVVNGTGGNVTRLRFRIVELTTFPPAPGNADLRALTSSNEVGIGPINDAGTCTASGAGSPPCTVTVKGLTLETPPAQLNGGGLNSSLTEGTITLGTPLANGASVNVNFLLGVQTTGKFRFLIIVEALP
jgi:CSLREA domain-containing protein